MNNDVYKFIETLTEPEVRAILRDDTVCLSVFRNLPALAQHLLLRALYIDKKMLKKPLVEFTMTRRPDNLASVDNSLKTLESLRLVQLESARNDGKNTRSRSGRGDRGKRGVQAETKGPAERGRATDTYQGVEEAGAADCGRMRPGKHPALGLCTFPLYPPHHVRCSTTSWVSRRRCQNGRKNC